MRFNENDGNTIIPGNKDADLPTAEVRIVVQDGAAFTAGDWTADEFIL